MILLFFAAAMFVCICATLLLGWTWLQGPNPEQIRLQTVLAGTQAVGQTARGGVKGRDRIAVLASELRRMLGLRDSPRIKQRLITAGLRSTHAGDVFFGMRCVTPLLGGLLGHFIPSNTSFWMFVLALSAYMATDVWLTMQTSKRKNTIRRSLPDAVDLLVICVDAGLGLDQAMLRVGQELVTSHPEINQEFLQVHLEQRAGKPRLEAWQSLADRTGVDELAAFVSMLTQTDRFGTPILRALNRFSEELRLKRRQRAEQAAAKTKIKIIFPLVLFIFPCIFIVLLAPAVINIADGLKAMAK